MLAEAHNLFLTLLVFASAALCIGADLSGSDFKKFLEEVLARRP